MTTAHGTHSGKPRMAYAKSNVTARRYSITPLRVLASLAVAAAVVIPVVFTMRDTTTPPNTSVNAAVQAVFPAANSLDVRQAVVGVTLSNSYVFRTLTIDNIQIPDDQINSVAALNQHSFRAAPEMEISSFAEGRHCATATYEPLNASVIDNGTGTYTWCFNLH